MCVRERRIIPRFLGNADRLGLQYVLAATVFRNAVAQDRRFENAVPLVPVLLNSTALAGSPMFVVAIFESITWRELVALVIGISFA